MYIYKIGYHSYEDSSYGEYSHVVKFNAKELEAIIEECIFAVIEMCVDDKPMEYPLFVADDGPHFDDIMISREFHDELVKRGFVLVEYQERFSVFGWRSTTDPKSWIADGDPTSEECQLVQRLKDRCEKAGIVITTKIGDTKKGDGSWEKYEYTSLARKPKSQD